MRALLRELCLPQARVWWLLFAAVAWAALDYWITCILYEPKVPWDIRVLYRAEGDTQYVGMVASLARGIFGEANLLDSFRAGVLGFPLGSLALHVLCVASFGAYGFAVADGLALCGSCVAFALLLRVLEVPTGLSRLVAIFSALGVTVALWVELSSRALLPVFSPLMGGQRLPRPLITEGLVLLTLALSLTYLQPARFARSTGRALGLGLSFGLLVQGDLHAATAVALVIASVLLLKLARERAARAACLEVALIAAAVLVALLPFIAQQLYVHPDIAPRMGAFTVSRLHPPAQWVEWRPRLLQVLAVLSAAALVRLALGRHPSRTQAWPALVGLLLVSLGFYGAMPAFGFLTGKGIQVYHFPDRFERATTLVVVAAGTLMLAWLTRRPLLLLWRRSRRPLLVALLAEGVVVVGLAFYARSALQERTHAVTAGPPREGWGLGSAYKSDLIQLTRELQKPEYAQARVLGTLDHGLSVWWTAFHHRFLLVNDPFPSTRSDAEQERRLMHFLQSVQVSPSLFRDMIQDPMLQIFWLSSAKYAVSPLHSFAPLAAYSPRQAKLITEGSVMSGWDLALPSAEVERWCAAFEAEPREPWRWADADVIALSRAQLDRGLLPRPSEYRLVFTNATFKVWRRI